MRILLIVLTLSVTLSCTGGNGEKSKNSTPMTSDSMMLANGYTVLELFKTRTGHITVSIDVNGKPCIFLIDTGGGATLIDKSKMRKYELTPSKTGDYAAGIGSMTSLVRTEATFQINGQDIKVEDLYLMDISYINAEFRKNRARQVDGVLGTDFLDRFRTVIDYAQQRMYLKVR